MKMTQGLVSSMLCAAIVLSFDFAAAQVVEEKLQWSKVQAPGSNKTSPLALQKKAEIGKKWNDCVTQAKNNSKKLAHIRPWILTSWLRCAREIALEKKSPESLTAPLKAVEGQPQMLISGPWKNQLWSEVIKARLLVIEQTMKTKATEAWKQIETLQEQKDQLDRPQKAKVLAFAGEISQGKGQMRAAQFFYEQSLLEQDNTNVRNKLGSVLLALNEKKPEKAAQVVDPTWQEAEGNFEERFRASLKTNDLLTLMEDCVTYLNQYPGGRKVKWAQEKVSEIYLSFFDQSRDERIKALRDRALNLMEKGDALRLLDWARILHRRSDYVGALRLSEKSLETLGSTTNGTVLAFVAGRSAQMSGDYAKAKKYFELYVDRYSGGEDLPEVLFRLGLVHLRLSQPSSAIAVFEKLLQQKSGEKYELNAKYWLARSLQATNNTRALSVADEILTKFPLSYYGLRLRMERSSGLLEWPTSLKVDSEIKGQYYLSQAQKKALDRIETLAKNGWTAEALWEMTEIPLPTDAVSKVLVAQKLNHLEMFPPVIRLVNEAGDLAPELRALDVVRLSLPQVYKESINEQATKQKLSPYLVRSLIRQESAFGPRATSSSNAYGLMQLIGPTAMEVSNELGLKGMSVPEDVYVPDNNIQMGTYYIAKMIRQFNGNVPLGLAAYNAGPVRVQIFKDLRKEVSDQTLKHSSDPWDEMWFDELPWYETSFYVKAILRNAILYQLAEKADSAQPDQRRVQFGSVLWANLVLNP